MLRPVRDTCVTVLAAVPHWKSGVQRMITVHHTNPLDADVRRLIDDGYEVTFSASADGAGYAVTLTGPLGSTARTTGATPGAALRAVWPLCDRLDGLDARAARRGGRLPARLDGHGRAARQPVPLHSHDGRRTGVRHGRASDRD
jgi:hypothetical protein